MSAVSELRAPRENHAVLAQPSFAELPARIEQNRHLLQNHSLTILGRDWHDLRRRARQDLLAAARSYLQQAGEPIPEIRCAESLFLAGHQPELFHPGVWVKNFALQRLAREHGATPVNLVVDNDTAKSAALVVPKFMVPTPPIEEFRPSAVPVPFDRWDAETPYEERRVEDESMFASFLDRSKQDWPFRPLLHAFWPEVLQQARRTPLLGERFAAARRTVERRWGCHNLEVPVSRVCESESFAWFFAHLVSELPRFHELHNRTVQEYRRRHGLRSRNHPVPDLGRDGDWLEAPFWAWRAGDQRRGRLHVRLRPDGIDLRVGQQVWPSLPRDVNIITSFREMQQAGYKVRHRALSNTFFARVFLADLFVHGIGGGKYDELTNDLIRGFYGLEPPSYLVLSATLLLPFPLYQSREELCHRLGHQWRDMHWNPQRHLEPAVQDHPAARSLAERKQELIQHPGTTRRQRQQWFFDLCHITEELRAFTAAQEAELHEQWQRCRRESEANHLLQNRDYAFCLHPEETLRPFCTQFLQGS